ncbi:MAG: S8 family serine peptidase, partial [Candidatus Promineifilaceae bacterium]
MTRHVFLGGLLLAVLFLVLAVFATSRAGARSGWQQKVDEWVLDTVASDGEVSYLVVLEDQAVLSGMDAGLSKLEKGELVYARLTAVARRTQPAVIASLEQAGAKYRPYWISNMIWVRSDGALVENLARRSDVAHIYANPWTELEALGEPLVLPESTELATDEWNLELINAPSVWDAGVTGQGAVIGGQDTGYDWQHPALLAQYRGWNGQMADHSYSWHDAIHEDNPFTAPGNPCGYDLAAPCDDRGHGTHTMGIMAGSDGADNVIGVAPGARWIGCRNMEEGWGTPASYAECYEWFVAPYPQGGDPFEDGNPAFAPHVINNSWSCPPAEGCTDPDILRAVVENVRAAGILTAHSAGNNG